MIDDFQVPDDPGYAYDDYGPGKALTPDLVDPACRRLRNLGIKGSWAASLLSSGLLRRI